MPLVTYMRLKYVYMAKPCHEIGNGTQRGDFKYPFCLP